MTDSTTDQPAEPQVVPFGKPAISADAGRPRTLAIANQKGGVGKTTTAINLGTALAAIGEHVLIVDLDPQGNASTGLGIERKSRRTSTYDVLTGASPMRDAVLPTTVPRLSIAPSTLDLSGLELEIGQQRDRAFRLRNALRQLNSGTRAHASRSVTAPGNLPISDTPALPLPRATLLGGARLRRCRGHGAESGGARRISTNA